MGLTSFENLTIKLFEHTELALNLGQVAAIV